MLYLALPYVAATVFLGGLTYRVALWMSTRPLKTTLATYPRHNLDLLRCLLPDQTVFPRLARHNYFLWGLAFTFHASLAAIVFGHLRLFQEPTWLWSLLRLDKSGVEAFAFYAGGMAGILMTVAAAGLSGRRLKGVTRLVSVPEDYFILAFIISLAFTGLYLRLFAVMNVQELQQYFTGLISLRLSLSPSVENPYYLVHSTITQLFLIYFPFSKLVHLAGSFITNYIYRR